MPTLLDTFVVSLARLIFSSSSFAIMANKSVLGAVQYTKSDSVDAGNGLANSPSIVQDMASMLEKGVDVSSSTTLPSFSSSTSDLAFQSRVPFNTPVPTPLPSSSHLCKQATVDVESPESKDAFPASFSTTASSFNISLISDISEEDEGSDPLVSSAPVTPQEATFPAGVGLGIAGLLRKDGSAPFDGLGRLYLPRQWQRSAPQDINSLSCVFSPCDRHGDLSLHSHGSTELSDIMLQEALLTFTDDPFHEHTLSSIPECRSWYELDQSGATEEEAATMSADKVVPPPPVSLQRRHSDKPRCVTPHFSSSTISSELKRSTSSLRKSTALSRKRSVTWPTSSSSRSIGGAAAVRVGSPSAALRSTSTPGGVFVGKVEY
ncbi:hypothetical protein NLJ89_g10126 [Agrocybe chaxingu]|uniref:Uncharacterized protein n=1 Tax=Agrocybe chaxingu TaxID=84603 RepID=A0A9W8JRS0_9AGAR|nr:hypothetical protein NLJ89_g10126 [Agrocybe chaxingu]